jgi:hypothetical protein
MAPPDERAPHAQDAHAGEALAAARARMLAEMMNNWRIAPIPRWFLVRPYNTSPGKQTKGCVRNSDRVVVDYAFG